MENPYGWLSLLPSLAAIVLAIATRRVVLSLLAGIFVGALITKGPHVLQTAVETRGWNIALAAYDTFEVHLWPTVTAPSRLRVFCFTLLMGAMIGIIHRSGGMRSLVTLVTPLAHSRRSGQLATWMMGLVIFFDDYANTLLLGSTFRSLCDKLKISREKLAYVVDSTAAPVAGLALVSTWVAVEIDYVKQGLMTLTDVGDLKAFDLFLASIPYRFYMLMALIFVPMVAIFKRDFGPMRHAEEKALNTGEHDTSALEHAIEDMEHEVADGRWYHAVIPILATLATVLGLLYQTGKVNLGAGGANAPLREIFGSADSSMALQYGALVGITLAWLMASAAGLLQYQQLLDATFRGARIVLPAIGILSTAAALSNLTGNRGLDGQVSTTKYEFKDYRLYTGDYLKSLIAPETDEKGENTEESSRDSDWSLKTLPTTVFLLSSVVAFCTGTSWGTMGILMPMVVTLAHALLTQNGQAISPTDPILLGSIGGVLAGAVFGDHCSPISDTTVLSSQSSGCDHIAHVRTQLPYAMTVAAVAVVFGTLPLGWNVSVWILLPAQLVALIAILLTFGKKTAVQDQTPG